jgi:hypothetical protein
LNSSQAHPGIKPPENFIVRLLFPLRPKFGNYARPLLYGKLEAGLERTSSNSVK